jgi:hypothetical protein
MVRRSPTGHRLGKRMDRLRTTTRRYQSQNQADNGKNPYRHSDRPTNTSLKTSRETRSPTLTSSKRVPPTLIRVQRG